MKKIRGVFASSVFVFIACSLAYGQLNFSTGSQLNSDLTYGTLIDSRDNTNYKTIQIGTQIWMAENLRYKIPNGSFAFDNDESIAERFGRLYDWKTAIAACPFGWHLPTNPEWDLLVDFLGGANIAGSKMKSAIGWESANEIAVNSSGFSALGAGYRHDDGTFGSIGANANFWSGTLVESELVWGRNLIYSSAKVNPRKYSSTNYYSVRCVKDETK
jgi:uncharacterized protein (TIGR02145 family)